MDIVIRIIAPIKSLLNLPRLAKRPSNWAEWTAATWIDAPFAARTVAQLWMAVPSAALLVADTMEPRRTTGAGAEARRRWSAASAVVVARHPAAAPAAPGTTCCWSPAECCSPDAESASA